MQSTKDEMQQELEAKIQKAVEKAEQAEKDLATSQTQLVELQSRTSNAASSLEEVYGCCQVLIQLVTRSFSHVPCFIFVPSLLIPSTLCVCICS